jgi:hypothetical protein
MSKPNDEATTYFQVQRNRDGLPEPGESIPAPVMPPLPPSSPFASDPVGPEPLVDRSEDSDVMGVAIDHLP